MTIKGVIFDFNGTLFWDTKLHNLAWDQFLEKHNINLTDQEKNEKIHGKNNKDILTGLFQEALTDEAIAILSKEKEDIYQNICLNENMQLSPGAIEFIEFLKEKEIPYTIATASDSYNVDFFFKQYKLDKYFDKSKVIYSNGKLKSKPNPEMFLNAIATLGVKADDTLIFEDSISGIKAAEYAKAAKIIIVNSNNDDYSNWDYQVIRDFSEVKREMF